MFREMQEMLLGQAGYVVSSHENPATALAAAGKQNFDLVVIDYELPGIAPPEKIAEVKPKVGRESAEAILAHLTSGPA